MRGYAVLFLVISLLFIVSCASSEAKAFLFERSRFAEPIVLGLPEQVDQSRIDTEVKRSSASSFLPIIPMDGWVNPDDKRIEFLQQEGYIRLTVLDYPSFGKRYFPDHPQKAIQHSVPQTGFPNFGGTGIAIAERRLKKITFKNSFEDIVSRQGKVTVHAFTFTYTLENLVPGLPKVTKEFVGKAEVIRDPADGEWKARSLSLPDREDMEYMQ